MTSDIHALQKRVRRRKRLQDLLLRETEAELWLEENEIAIVADSLAQALTPRENSRSLVRHGDPPSVWLRLGWSHLQTTCVTELELPSSLGGPQMTSLVLLLLVASTLDSTD